MQGQLHIRCPRLFGIKVDPTEQSLAAPREWHSLNCVTSKTLHSEPNFERCWNWDTPERRSAIPRKVLKCDAAEEWGGSVGKIVREVKYYIMESRRRGISYEQWKGGKANWIGHIWCSTCLLKHVMEGTVERRIEGAGRRGRRHKQLLDDVKEKLRYCKLKEEVLYRTLCRTHSGGGYRSVVRKITEWMNVVTMCMFIIYAIVFIISLEF